MCIYAQDMKFLWSNLLLGGLSTDDANDNDDNNNDTGHHTVIFSGVLNLSCLVNKEWTMYCCEQ